MDSRFPAYDFFINNLLIISAVYLIACFCVAWIWGRKRKIGFLWSFIFSVLMTPLVGVAITLAGKERRKDYL